MLLHDQRCPGLRCKKNDVLQFWTDSAFSLRSSYLLCSWRRSLLCSLRPAFSRTRVLCITKVRAIGRHPARCSSTARALEQRWHSSTRVGPHNESHKESYKESYKESHKELHKESHKELYESHKESHKEPHKEVHMVPPNCAPSNSPHRSLTGTVVCRVISSLKGTSRSQLQHCLCSTDSCTAGLWALGSRL